MKLTRTTNYNNNNINSNSGGVLEFEEGRAYRDLNPNLGGRELVSNIHLTQVKRTNGSKEVMSKYYRDTVKVC